MLYTWFRVKFQFENYFQGNISFEFLVSSDPQHPEYEEYKFRLLTFQNKTYK